VSAPVSVIIPAFRSAFLKEALASVFAQTVQPAEVIVIDGSPDETLPAIEEYRDHLRYFFQNPSGVSAARNYGIQLADEEYIAFLDADDVWLPTKLERQMRAFEMQPDAGFCFAGIWNLCDFDAPSIPQEVFLPAALMEWMREHRVTDDLSCGFAYSLLLQVNCIGTSSLVVTRAAAISERFDEKLKNAEDYDFELRLARKHPGIFLHEPVSRYRIHGFGLSGIWENRPEIFYESNVRVLWKHLKRDFSPEILRSLAGTYREYARWSLNARRLSTARVLALKSLCFWPNGDSAKVCAESWAPVSYRLLSKAAQRNRIG
jgi:glycosyltransferase involved in cell wall biosynthesis